MMCGRSFPALLSLLALCTCAPATPTAAERQVDGQLLEGMHLVVVEWPDTLVVGQRAPATVQVLLANDVPYRTELIYWQSTDVSAAGLYPTALRESKQVIAFAPDTVSVRVDAYVERVDDPESIDDYYHARLLLHLVVIPAPGQASATRGIP